MKMNSRRKAKFGLTSAVTTLLMLLLGCGGSTDYSSEQSTHGSERSVGVPDSPMSQRSIPAVQVELPEAPSPPAPELSPPTSLPTGVNGDRPERLVPAL